MTTLRQHANEIADELLKDLRAELIPSIGIDQITSRCMAVAVQTGITTNDMERLIELTTRCVVEKVG